MEMLVEVCQGGHGEARRDESRFGLIWRSGHGEVGRVEVR